MSGIGVLALQGDFVEHIKTFSSLGVSAQEIRKANQISDLDALVIPGGESTTISYLMDLYNFRSAIKDAASSDLPIWGTCAGLILMANNLKEDIPRLRAVSKAFESGYRASKVVPGTLEELHGLMGLQHLIDKYPKSDQEKTSNQLIIDRWISFIHDFHDDCLLQSFHQKSLLP